MPTPPPFRRPAVSQHLLAMIVVIALVAAFMVIRQSSCTVVLGAPWEDNGLIPIEQVDHAEWSTLLRRYVDHQGRVDYDAWHRNPADVQSLVDYLETLSRVHWNPDRTPNSRLSDTRTHELAFWINAHNALTVRAILGVYPTSSVRRHINPVGFDIQNHYKLIVGSRAFSLNDIVDGPVLELNEPRVHFALVRGSVSCPALLDEAWQPAKIHEQLAASTRRFFSRPGSVQMEGTARIHLSSVVREALPHLGDDLPQQRARIASFLDDPRAAELVKCDTIPISYVRHDWSLNKQ